MSIASDLRSYADTAVSQGKQVLDQAQTQLNDVTGQANELFGKTKGNVSDIAGKATDAVNDLRASAEKAINFDAIKTAVEPYLAQVKDYTSSVTDRADALFSGVKSDPRVAKLVDATRPVTSVVVETVQDRVVKPIQSLTGIGTSAATPAPKAAAKPATKPAATKPAATKPASKPTTRKAPAKRVTKS
jgi:uncharacterized protein YjbJ (UPF0337 family)